MTDKKPTDKDIVKALECCARHLQQICIECPLYENLCTKVDLKQQALELINRQKEEIERLKERRDKWKQIAEDFDKASRDTEKEIEDLQTENEKLKTNEERYNPVRCGRTRHSLHRNHHWRGRNQERSLPETG